MDKLPVTFISCNAVEIYDGAVYDEYPVSISVNQITYFRPARDENYTEIRFANGNGLFIDKKYDDLKLIVL